MMHPIENIMKSAMEEIKEMVDVNTIIGDPILTGNETMILPVSKVSLGFLSGGGEYGMGNKPVRKSGTALDGETGGEENGQRYPFAGTAVAGMSLTPMAFLSVNAGCVKVCRHSIRIAGIVSLTYCPKQSALWSAWFAMLPRRLAHSRHNRRKHNSSDAGKRTEQEHRKMKQWTQRMTAVLIAVLAALQ